MDLEIIIVRKARQHMISLCVICKNDKNELSYKREIDSQTQETNLWLPKGKELERDKFGVWD